LPHQFFACATHVNDLKWCKCNEKIVNIFLENFHYFLNLRLELFVFKSNVVNTKTNLVIFQPHTFWLLSNLATFQSYLATLNLQVACSILFIVINSGQYCSLLLCSLCYSLMSIIWTLFIFLIILNYWNRNRNRNSF